MTVTALYALSSEVFIGPGDILEVVRTVPPGPPVDDDELRQQLALVEKMVDDDLSIGQPPSWQWNLAAVVLVLRRLLDDRSDVSIIELILVVSRMLGARAWYLEHGRPDRHVGKREHLLDVLVRQVAVAEIDEWEQHLLERGTGDPVVTVSVGARIRYRRAEVGVTQAQLAGILGVERSTVVRWEADERAPHAGHRVALARFLGGQPSDYDGALAGHVRK